MNFFEWFVHVQGRMQDFKLGGAHLKKLRRAEGGAKNFGVFRVKNHDFTPPPGSAPDVVPTCEKLIITCDVMFN
jgi:hypothetical protein